MGDHLPGHLQKYDGVSLHPAYRVGMGMPSLDFEVMSIIYRKPIHDKSAREKNKLKHLVMFRLFPTFVLAKGGNHKATVFSSSKDVPPSAYSH